jgi:hypothetical protein
MENLIFESLLENRKDFQIKKSSKFSCGVGRKARPRYGTGKDAHPTIWRI